MINLSKPTNLNAAAAASRTLLLCSVLVVLQSCASVSAAPTPSKFKATTTKDPFAITARADRAYQRGDWLVAERYYAELTRTVPKDAYGWMRLGNIRLRQNNFTGAVYAYRAAIERDPDASRAHYNLATAHLLLARDALEKASQHLPANDAGVRIIGDKLRYFDRLIYEPYVEVASPNDGLIGQRGGR